MSRIQMLIVPAALLVLVAGCSQTEQTAQTVPDPIIADALQRTVLGDWLHDIDAAQPFIDYAANLPKKQLDRQDVQNSLELAFRATILTLDANDCWPKNKAWTTATTDHACLDALGYKRSR